MTQKPSYEELAAQNEEMRKVLELVQLQLDYDCQTIGIPNDRPADIEVREALALTPPAALNEAVAKERERKYPCEKCGLLRTKAEGGTTFTVCDKCWDAAAIRRGEGRLHKLCCDDAHQHQAPKCCAPDCWCGRWEGK